MYNPTPSEDASVAEDQDSARESASQNNSDSEAPSISSQDSLYGEDEQEDPAYAAAYRAWQEDVVFACRHIAMGKWPQLAAFNFAQNTLSAESMAELGKGDWLALKSLNMSHTIGEFWEQLVAAPWRMLQDLDLSHGGALRMDDLSHLRHADWPHLTALELPGFAEEGDSTDDTVSISRAWHLIKQQWALQKLRLHTCCTVEVQYEVQFSNWHALKWLDIFKAQLTPEQVETLLQAYGQQLDTLYVTCRVEKATIVQPKPESWPQSTFLRLLSDLETAALQSLSFGYWSALEVARPEFSPTSIRTQPQLMAAMAELLNVDLTRVDRLDLSSFVADKDLGRDAVPIAALTDLPRAFQVLSACQWPALRTLDLSNNLLSDEVVLPLTAGEWPLLEQLDLSGNQLQLAGAHQLVHAKWPLLARLHLYENAFNGQGIEFPRTDRINLVRCLKSAWLNILVHLGHSDPDFVFHDWAGIPRIQATLCRTSLTPTCAIDRSKQEWGHTVMNSRFSKCTTVEW